MITIISSSLLLFIATELDDFLLFTVLFARQKKSSGKILIFAGQTLALLTVTLFSAFCSRLLQQIPETYLRFIGIFPVLLGLKYIFFPEKEDEENGSLKTGLFLTSVILTFSASADNLGIYIPFFTNFKTGEKLLAALIFVILQCFWSFLQSISSSIPIIKKMVEKTSAYLIPAVFILTGIFIILF